MEQFATEDQQVEAIKKFWKDNGTSIIVGAVIGLAALWGWREYSESQIASKEAASSAYQTALEAIGDNNNTTQLNAFIEGTDDSGYADIAGLVAAQQSVASGDLAAAASYLQGVVTKASDPQLANIARIRLARIQLQLENTDDALKTIEAVENDAYNALVEEVKGDIYSKLGNFDKARMAYTAALEENANNRLLQMKLDNLAVSAG
jgi:predicted negative regulator of RcsB-dependent stress response